MTPSQVCTHLARRRDRLVVFGRLEAKDGLIVFGAVCLVTHMTDVVDPVVCAARFCPNAAEPVKVWHGIKPDNLSQSVAEQCNRRLSDMSRPGLDNFQPCGDHLVTCQQSLISIDHPQMLQILVAIWAVVSQTAYNNAPLTVILRRLRALIDQANRAEAARHLLP